MAYDSLEEAIATGHGTERQFLCHVHEDTNASASVNVVKGLWVCYGCGAGGRVDTDRIEINPEWLVKNLRRLEESLAAGGPKTYSERWLGLFTAAGPGDYWLSRFTPEACKHFDLGMMPDGSAATYPLRDHAGRILGVVQRNLSEEGPKYRYPFGIDTTDFLYNYHACEGDEIVLVEGATDAIAAWEAGYEAMAIYGSRLSAKQAALLRRYAPRKMILAFDQDEAGQRAVHAVQLAFPEVEVVPAVWPATTHDGTKQDLASMPVPTRKYALSGRLAQRARVRIVSSHGDRRA